MFRTIGFGRALVPQVRNLSALPAGIKNAALWNPTSCFINGKFTMDDHNEKFAVINPANGETIAMMPKMTANDTAQCEKISWDSWQKWKKTTAKERSKIIGKMAALMHTHIEDLARIITLEAGKPLAESRGEILYAAGFMEWYAEEAKRTYGDVIPPPVHGRKYITLRQPVGPSALITPWNFPSAMITRKVCIVLYDM
jgi:succinate-semialdehyde dehydrogenase / glutarate-semialdehyde dehydrogenase